MYGRAGPVLLDFRSLSYFYCVLFKDLERLVGVEISVKFKDLAPKPQLCVVFRISEGLA